MSIDARIVLNGHRSLPEVCAPLAAALDRCFWVVDLYSGPFRADWVFASEENEALYERQYWEVPVFRDTGTHGFRPGTIPQLAEYLVLDEWSYYFAIDAAEEVALRRASLLAGHIGDLSRGFLRGMDEAADLLICHVDGWWEFFTGRPEWFERLRAAWADGVVCSLDRAGCFL
jgi:hypothetical protein